MEGWRKEVNGVRKMGDGENVSFGAYVEMQLRGKYSLIF